MKFIFPQNYAFKNKLLGIIDYSTALANVFWYVIVFIFVNLFFRSLELKICFFIFLSFPFFLISVTGLNGENILYVFKYFFKFIVRPKIYF